MKKVLLVLLILISLVGCSKNKVNQEPEVSTLDYSVNYNNMLNKLKQLGNSMFNNDNWLTDKAFERLGIPYYTEISGEQVPGFDYFVSLEQLSSLFSDDMSIFINPKTNEKCDMKTTGVKLSITTKKENSEYYNYEIIPILVCGNE